MREIHSENIQEADSTQEREGWPVLRRLSRSDGFIVPATASSLRRLSTSIPSCDRTCNICTACSLSDFRKISYTKTPACSNSSWRLERVSAAERVPSLLPYGRCGDPDHICKWTKGAAISTSPAHLEPVLWLFRSWHTTRVEWATERRWSRSCKHQRGCQHYTWKQLESE